MDCFDSELLTRAEILQHLQQRRLRTDALELLSTEELLKLYNNFAVPLEPRSNRRHGIASNTSVEIMAVDSDMNEVGTVELVRKDELIKKRSINDSNCYMSNEDSFLISATKRIKIDWL